LSSSDAARPRPSPVAAPIVATTEPARNVLRLIRVAFEFTQALSAIIVRLLRKDN
jgi:hypothetical protein